MKVFIIFGNLCTQEKDLLGLCLHCSLDYYFFVKFLLLNMAILYDLSNTIFIYYLNDCNPNDFTSLYDFFPAFYGFPFLNSPSFIYGCPYFYLSSLLVFIARQYFPHFLLEYFNLNDFSFIIIKLNLLSFLLSFLFMGICPIDNARASIFLFTLSLFLFIITITLCQLSSNVGLISCHQFCLVLNLFLMNFLFFIYFFYHQIGYFQLEF